MSWSLHGIPFLVKNSFDIKGIPTTAATPALRINIPSTNGPVIQSLLDAGAIVLGCTNLAEMSLALTTPNDSFAGVCKNPYNLNYTSGGSSGGSGAGVAAYFTPFAVGEDTGGSIRSPAMCCGLYTLRPTTKRYSQEGIVPVGVNFDTAGVLTRSVRDIELLDAVITGQKEKVVIDKRKLRIGIPTQFFYENLTYEVKAAMDTAIAKLEAAGITLVYKNVNSDFNTDGADQATIITEHFSQTLNAYLDKHVADPNNPLLPITADQVVAQIVTPAIKAFGEFLSNPAPPAILDPAKARQAAQQQVFANYWQDNRIDAIFIPAAANVALLLSVPIADAFTIYDKYFSVVPFNELPAVSLPVGLTSVGLPVGAELVGPHLEDRRLIAIGKLFQKILGRIAGPPGF